MVHSFDVPLKHSVLYCEIWKWDNDELTIGLPLFFLSCIKRYRVLLCCSLISMEKSLGDIGGKIRMADTLVESYIIISITYL